VTLNTGRPDQAGGSFFDTRRDPEHYDAPAKGETVNMKYLRQADTRIQEMPIGERPEVVMISGHGSIESAVRATKLGAFDFFGEAALDR